MEQVEKLFTDLGQMRSRNGSLACTNESIMKLTRIWTAIGLKLLVPTGNMCSILKRVSKLTASQLLNGNYTKKIDHKIKSDLRTALEGAADTRTELRRICTTFVTLSNAPWTGPIFKSATTIMDEPNADAIEALWESEGLMVLECRVEIIWLMKNRSPEIAKVMERLLTVCVSEGWKKFTTEEFDLFTYTKDEYVDVLMACILLWAKKLVDVKLFVKMPVTRLVEAASKLSKSHSPARILPELWISLENAKQLSFEFMNNFTTAVIMHGAGYNDIRELYDMWLEMNLKHIEKDEEKVSRVNSIVGNLSVETVQDTATIYTLADFLLSKMGMRDARELVVRLYIRATMVDINRVVNARINVPLREDEDAFQLHCEKAKQLSASLSLRIRELSQLFIGYKETYRNLRVTAFSLNPTVQLFNDLFPTSIPTTETLSEEEEEPKLPQDIFDDLETVIHTPRWAGLFGKKGDELRETCRLLLDENFCWLSSGRNNADLEHVNVNYSQFSHLPSKYDSEDDGVQRGFTHGGTRKKKITIKTLQPYIRQRLTTHRFLRGVRIPRKVAKARAEAMEEQYTLAYLRPLKTIPGIRRLTPIVYRKKKTITKTGDTGYIEKANRRYPVHYIRPAVPSYFKQKLDTDDSEDFKLTYAFRASRDALSTKVVDRITPDCRPSDMARVPRSFPTLAGGDTTYDKWAKFSRDFDVTLTSSLGGEDIATGRGKKAKLLIHKSLTTEFRTPYVVPKGCSVYERFLHLATNDDFEKALDNLSGEPAFDCRVWQLFTCSKTIREIQDELKCDWNTVQKRLNDANYVDRLVALLYQHSSKYQSRIESVITMERTTISQDQCHIKLPLDFTGTFLFPVRQNFPLAGAGETIVKVLDERSGRFVGQVLPIDEDDFIDAGEFPVPGSDWSDDDEKHIRELEEEHWKLLDEVAPQIQEIYATSCDM